MCGYNIKAYYETEQQKEVISNTFAAPINNINVKAIIGVVVAHQLEYNGFIYEQVVYGVDQAGL